MKLAKKISLLLALAIAAGLSAQKISEQQNEPADKQKTQNLMQQWMTGLLSGKDMSGVSKSYSQQLQGSKKSTHPLGNDTLWDFNKKYSQYLKDLNTLKQMEQKDTGEQQWQSRIEYLKQSYQQARKSQIKLLDELKAKKQFLLENNIVQEKLILIDDLIKKTNSSFSATTIELMQ